MKKPSSEKLPLTTEQIRKQVHDCGIAMAIQSAIFLLLFLILVGSMTGLFILVCSPSHPHDSAYTAAVIFVVLILATVLLLSILIVPHFVRGIRGAVKCLSGQYRVAEDKLVALEKGRIPLRVRLHSKNVVSGDGYDGRTYVFAANQPYRFICSESHTDLDRVDDPFYLVILDGSQSPLLIYNARIYDLQDR